MNATILEAIKGIERLLANGLFALLLLGCMIATGWLVARQDHYWDWTGERANFLSPELAAILSRLDAPLHATVFADPQDALGKAIERFLARYRHALRGLTVRFLDP